MVDLDMVLDELWSVTREEMNFLTEAANMEEFRKQNEEVVFVGVPKLYQEYTTTHVLVMEYIDGIGIDDKETLRTNGYDLDEIGSKLADNFIRQVIEDGFFMRIRIREIFAYGTARSSGSIWDDGTSDGTGQAAA